LPKIPTNILTSRLKELEAAGVIARRASSQPGGGVLYELTPLGLELEQAVLALGRWGAKNLLDEPRPDEILTNDSMVMALRTTFQPHAAKGVHASYELRMGPVAVHARIDDGTIDAGAGTLPDADLLIEAGPALKAVMAREITPREAISRNLVHLTGDAALFDLFAQMFRI
jgi:DNA-binding MarR family transcriptional regulator